MSSSEEKDKELVWERLTRKEPELLPWQQALGRGFRTGEMVVMTARRSGKSMLTKAYLEAMWNTKN